MTFVFFFFFIVRLPPRSTLSVTLFPYTTLCRSLAVLPRHTCVATFVQDVFVNAVGGVKITEPAADLPVLLAIVSSLRNRPLPKGLVVDRKSTRLNSSH